VSTGSGIEGEGWATPIAGPGDVWLSRNLDPMPRVRLAHSWETVGNRSDLLSMLQADGYDPRGQVLLETPMTGIPPSFRGGPTDETLPARETGPGSWEINVPPGGEALVVLSESYDPDWIAEKEDGTRIPLLRADGLFLAFVAPEEGGRLRLRHAPSSLRLGAVLSAVGLVAFALAMAIGRRRRTTRVRAAAGAPTWVAVPVSRFGAPVVVFFSLIVMTTSIAANVGDATAARRASTLSAAAVRSWVGEAGAALRAGATDPAIGLLRIATRFANHDASVHYRLGLALRQAGRSGEAIESFERALAIDPGMSAAEKQVHEMQQ
jgi:hypothetical protein